MCADAGAPGACGPDPALEGFDATRDQARQSLTPQADADATPSQRTGVAKTLCWSAAISLAERPGTASGAQGIVSPRTMQ